MHSFRLLHALGSPPASGSHLKCHRGQSQAHCHLDPSWSLFSLSKVSYRPSIFHSVHWPVANLYSKRSFLFFKLELE
jgi:hypothetical protein